MGYSVIFRVYLDGKMVPLGNGRKLANITYGGKSIDHGENVYYGDYLSSFVLTLEDTAKYTLDRATAYYKTTLESPAKYVLHEFKPYSGDNKYIHRLRENAPYGDIQILVHLETFRPPEDPDPDEPFTPLPGYLNVYTFLDGEGLDDGAQITRQIYNTKDDFTKGISLRHRWGYKPTDYYLRNGANSRSLTPGELEDPTNNLMSIRFESDVSLLKKQGYIVRDITMVGSDKDGNEINKVLPRTNYPESEFHKPEYDGFYDEYEFSTRENGVNFYVNLETNPEDLEGAAKWVDVVDPAGTISLPDGKFMYNHTPTLFDGRHPTSRRPHHQIRADVGAMVEMFSTDRKATLYADGIYRVFPNSKEQRLTRHSAFYRSTIIEPYIPKRNGWGDYIPILSQSPWLNIDIEMDGHPAPVPDGDVPFELKGGAWGKKMPAHWSYYTDEAPPLQKGYNYIENLGKNTIVEVVRTDSNKTSIPLLEGDKLSVPDDIQHINILPIDGYVLSPTRILLTGTDFPDDRWNGPSQGDEHRDYKPITWNGRMTFYKYIRYPEFYKSPDPNYRRLITIDWDSVPDGSIRGNPFNSKVITALPPLPPLDQDIPLDPWQPVPDPWEPVPDPDPKPDPDPTDPKPVDPVDPKPDPKPDPDHKPDPDPIITHTGILGFNNVYYIDSKERLQVISDEIYKRIGYGTGDLKDYIINTIQLPFSIPVAYMTTPTYITLGNTKIMTFTRKVTTDSLKLRIGTITTPRKHNNSNDYINTTTTIHLPYSGYVELEPNYVIGQTINVYYIIDMYTGEATINLTSSFIGDKVFYSNKVMVGNVYPYLDTKWNNSTVRNLEQTKSVLQNNVDDPYIEVVRNMQYQPESQFNQEIRTTVDRLLMTTGLVYVHDIELNIDTTREELDRIKSTLASGIIIKAPE